MKKVNILIFVIIMFSLPFLIYSMSVIPSNKKSKATLVTSRTADANKLNPAEKEKKIWEDWNWAGKGCEYEFQEQLLNEKLFTDFEGDKKTIEILFDGLKSDVCFAKWQSAYMICEYLDVVDKNELRKTLNSLLNDEAEKIRNAAAFTIAVMDKDFSNQKWFLKSPDGSKCAFTLYKDTSYPGYNIWIAAGDKIKKIPFKIGSITKIVWSPDSKYVAAESFQGRWSSWCSIIDVENEKIFKQINEDFKWFRENPSITNLFPDNGYNNPYLSFESWGTNGTSAIIKWFVEYNAKNCKGTVEYDFANEKIDNLVIDKQ